MAHEQSDLGEDIGKFITGVITVIGISVGVLIGGLIYAHNHPPKIKACRQYETAIECRTRLGNNYQVACYPEAGFCRGEKK